MKMVEFDPISALGLKLSSGWLAALIFGSNGVIWGVSLFIAGGAVSVLIS